VVDLLADAGNELGGALTDPWSEAGFVVSLLAADPGNLATALEVRHDDQPLALAEPRRRRALGEPRDLLDRLAGHAALLEPPNGPPPHDDVDELHGASSRPIGLASWPRFR
jgi:hypothetical protein